MAYVNSNVFNNSYNLVANKGAKAPIVQAQGLPVELWHQVFQSLSTIDLCHVRVTDRTFCQLMTEGVAAGAVKIAKSKNQKTKEIIEILRPYITANISPPTMPARELGFNVSSYFDANGELVNSFRDYWYNEHGTIHVDCSGFYRDPKDNVLKYRKVQPNSSLTPWRTYAKRYLLNGMERADTGWGPGIYTVGLDGVDNIRLLDQRFMRGANRLAERDGLYRYADPKQSKKRVRPDWEAVIANPSKYPNDLLWDLGKPTNPPLKDNPSRSREVKVTGQIAPFKYEMDYIEGQPPPWLRQNQSPPPAQGQASPPQTIQQQTGRVFQRAVPQNNKPQVILAGANRQQLGPIPSATATKSKGCCAKLLALLKRFSAALGGNHDLFRFGSSE